VLLELSTVEGYRVRGLFIENNPVFRRWVNDLVGSKIEFIEAENFQEALELLSGSLHVDFILVDWEMLNSNGLDSLQNIQKASGKPIILLTGRDLSEQESSLAVSHGVVELLRKEEIQKRCEELEASRPTLKLETTRPLVRDVIDAIASTTGQDIEASLHKLDMALLKLKE